LKHGQKETYHTKRNEAPPEQQYDEFLAPCLHCHKLLERVSKLAACQCAANRIVLNRTDMSFDMKLSLPHSGNNRCSRCNDTPYAKLVDKPLTVVRGVNQPKKSEPIKCDESEWQHGRELVGVQVEHAANQ
jgi:hypothetical protein